MIPGHVDMGVNHRGYISGIVCMYCGLETKGADVPEHLRTAHPAFETAEITHRIGWASTLLAEYRPKITPEEMRAIGRRSQWQVL